MVAITIILADVCLYTDEWSINWVALLILSQFCGKFPMQFLTGLWPFVTQLNCALLTDQNETMRISLLISFLFALTINNLNAQSGGFGYFIPPFDTKPVVDFAEITQPEVHHISDFETQMPEVALVNNSMHRIFSAQLKYQVNGGEVLTKECIDLDVQPGDEFRIAIAIPALTKGEKHSLNVWAEEVNGDPSIRLGNSGSEIWALSVASQRIPLVEMFTSSTCGPCKTMNEGLNPVLQDASNYGRFACVKYQMNWPGGGDPYYTSEGGRRQSNYAVSGVPALFMDGTRVTTGTYQGNIDTRFADPTDLELEGTYNFDPSTRTIDVAIDMDCHFNYGPYHRLWVALVEKTTYDNKRTNGENEFEYVFMDFLNDKGGIGDNSGISDLANGLSKTFNYSKTYGESDLNIEEWDDIAILVWIQQSSTEEVLNSAWVINSASGLNTPSSLIADLEIFPNPNNGKANLTFDLKESADVQLKVFNLQGQEVFAKDLGTLGTGDHRESFDIDNAPAGVYFLDLILDGKHSQRSFQIN